MKNKKHLCFHCDNEAVIKQNGDWYCEDHAQKCETPNCGKVGKFVDWVGRNANYGAIVCSKDCASVNGNLVKL